MKKWKDRSKLQKGLIIAGGITLTEVGIILTREFIKREAGAKAIKLSSELIKQARFDGFVDGVSQGIRDGDTRGYMRGIMATKSFFKKVDFDNPIIKDLIKKYGFNAVIDYLSSKI